MQWKRREGKCKGNGDGLIEASEKKEEMEYTASGCCYLTVVGTVELKFLSLTCRVDRTVR